MQLAFLLENTPVGIHFNQQDNACPGKFLDEFNVLICMRDIWRVSLGKFLNSLNPKKNLIQLTKYFPLRKPLKLTAIFT